MSRILIVDDDRLVRESLELELLDAGFEVTTASDGMTALGMAQEQTFELVLSDIRMPGMQGLEVLAELKACQPELKTIVMTGYASPETPIEALRLRVDDYLMKPFDGDKLLASIQSLLSIRTHQSVTRERRLDSFLELLNWLLEHGDRNAEIARRAVELAESVGCDPSRVDRLYLAAVLSSAPQRFCRTQAWLEPVQALQEKARENWDGSGPLGLKGEQIPLEARILAVAQQREQDLTDPSLLGPSPSLGKELGIKNLLRLGEKYLELDQSSEALEILRRAEKLGTQEPEVRVALARGKAKILRVQGNDDEARGELLQLRAFAQTHHLDLTAAELALELTELGDFAGREEALKEAAQVFERWERSKDQELAKAQLAGSQAPPPVIDSETSLVEIQLLGGLSVRFGETVLDDEDWVSRKDRSLFAYLSYHSSQVIHEDKLLELFWSGGGPKAKHSLHNAISKIRKTLKPILGPDAKRLIQKKRDGYLFGKVVPHRVDTVEFSRLTEHGELESLRMADALYQGEFLQGTYESWADAVRWQLRDKLSECRSQIAMHFGRASKHEVASQLWERVLEHDPCHEVAYCELMKCFKACSRNADAIRTYHRCVKTLKEELDLGPPPEIVRLYLELIDSSSKSAKSGR